MSYFKLIVAILKFLRDLMDFIQYVRDNMPW